MKMKTIALASIAAFGLVSAAAQADTATVNGGTVHFKGEVVSAACAVDAGSVDQTVQLGQVKTSTLTAANSTSSPVGFNIQLDDCDTTATQASIIWNGTQGGANNILALQSSSAGGATNVGVQVLDKAGTPVVFDGATASTANTLSTGTNTLPFQARYISLNGGATAGTANADATFKVQYQ